MFRKRMFSHLIFDATNFCHTLARYDDRDANESNHSPQSCIKIRYGSNFHCKLDIGASCGLLEHASNNAGGNTSRPGDHGRLVGSESRPGAFNRAHPRCAACSPKA